MTWILDETELILRGEKFSTVRLPDSNVIAFEDETVFGFVLEYDVAISLLAKWQADENALLERFAPALRGSGDKSWNVYSVFLTEGELSDALSVFNLESIEENLRHTRKIPRVAVRSPADVKAALSPILGMSSQLALSIEPFRDRLARRLEAEAGQAVSRIFFSEGDEELAVRALSEGTAP